MKTVPATKVKAVDTLQWIRKFVAQQRRTSPEILVAIWMNPTDDPFALMEGVEMVLICDIDVDDAKPEFRPTRFAPNWGKPGMILTMTSPVELSVDFDLNGRKSYFNKLKTKVESNRAKIVYPNTSQEPVEILNELLMPVEVSS